MTLAAAPKRGRLFRRYALLINALVGALLLASAVLSLTFSYRESRDHLASLQLEQAQGAAARIGQYLSDIEQQLGWTGLSGMQTGGDPVELRRIDYLKLLRQVPAITEAAWIDPWGREQLRVSRLAMDTQGLAIDRSTEPVFTEPSAGRVWRSAVSFRKQTEPYMTIARRAGSGGNSGVTVVEVNLKSVWDVVADLRPGEAGVAYVVDQNGALIAHPDISLVLKQTSLAVLPQVRQGLHPPAPDGGRGVMLDGARNLDGDPVLSAWARLEPQGWRVFVESSRAQAVAPLLANLQRLGALLAVGMVISVLASAWLARTLVRPIRALQAGAVRAAAGDLDQRIDVGTDDELGALAGEFNRMAAELKAAHAGLERKVEQRTAELADTLAQQTATAEVLQVLSHSVSDAQPVFEKILSSTEQLFGSRETAIFLLSDDGQLHLQVATGRAAALLARIYPLPLEQTSGLLVIQGRQQVVFADVLHAADVPPSLRRAGMAMGNFSVVLTPMLWNSRGIGLIAVRREPNATFTDKELRLLRTFADQAVIAIQNARLFDALETKSHQLEVASRHKSEFLANMSHELRTPLNAIIGFSEVLVEQMFGELNPKQMEYLQDIHSSGHHLLTLINDVLDLSKIEAGRMELELSEFDVAELLETALNLVHERAGRHGLTLSLDIAPGIETWVADARKVKQTLLNLLSNAIKFTPAGGAVQVAVRSNEAGQLEIAVADTGIGIAPQDQARIFEEFHQASGSYLRKAEGTGLGLSLARRFIELHGGHLGLASTSGQGSTFTFVLPARTLGAAVPGRAP